MHLIIGPALLFGLLIGLYEVIIVHRDVKNPEHRFKHTLHALVLTPLFVFCSMNAQQIFLWLPFLSKIPFAIPLSLQILAGLIAAIKIHAVSQVSKLGFRAKGLGETWFHSILIGSLVVLAPYIYPVLKPILPNWLLF